MYEEIKKYNIQRNGVIHVGAHIGCEIEYYNNLGFTKIVFFEPIKSTFNKLTEFVNSHNKDINCEITFINKAIGNKIGNTEMFVETANNGQSSSILKPLHHLIEYPSIVFPQREIVEISTLDNEIKEKKYFNVLNVDVQGYELEVFRGATNLLNTIDIINSEVNRIEMYENCPLIGDIDNFLSDFGFQKISEDFGCSNNWGDAVYIKKSFL